MIESCPYRQQICDLRLRCFTCRSYAEWRKYNNFPEVCPHGVAAANLPTPHKPSFDPAGHARQQAIEAGSTTRRCCGG
jgi:hypothetical protein